MISTFSRSLSIGALVGWLSAVVLLPVGILLLTSVWSSDGLSLRSYHQLFDPIFLAVLWRSSCFAFFCTLITLLIAYPAAYVISRTPARLRPLLLLLMLVPFWTSSLIRLYAVIALLKTQGMLNQFLLSIGIIRTPLRLLYSNVAVLIGMIYSLLPFMILPLYSNFSKIDRRLFDAARDLGATRWRLFWNVVFPLTLPGILVGMFFVFLPAMTLFYIPNLLGGAKSLLLGNLIEMQFLNFQNSAGGAATSICLTVFLLILLWVYRGVTGKLPHEGIS